VASIAEFVPPGHDSYSAAEVIRKLQLQGP